MYKLNKNYFDKIDSHNKAYFLGFITADGYNSNKKGTVVITQSGIQSEILYKLRKEIESNSPITKKKKNNENDQDCYEFRICSKHISNVLIKYGVVQNKSHITYFPDIDEKYYNSYILGYYDGDGGINFYSGNYNNSTINMTGNDDLINRIREILKTKFDRNGSIYTRHINSPNIITLGYTGKRSCYKILTWLYSDSTLFIESKKNKYYYLRDLINIINEKKIKRIENENNKLKKKIELNNNNIKIKEELDSEILKHLIGGYSIRQIKIKFKRNTLYIRDIINKNNISYGKRKRMFAVDPQKR